MLFFGHVVIYVAAEQVSKTGTAAGSIVIPVPSIGGISVLSYKMLVG